MINKSKHLGKQIAINLAGGVSCTIRANDGVHCAYNLLVSPPPISADGCNGDNDKWQKCRQIVLNATEGRCSPAIVAHFANLGPRNIFNRWYKAPGVMVICEKK